MFAGNGPASRRERRQAEPRIRRWPPGPRLGQSQVRQLALPRPTMQAQARLSEVELAFSPVPLLPVARHTPAGRLYRGGMISPISSACMRRGILSRELCAIQGVLIGYRPLPLQVIEVRLHHRLLATEACLRLPVMETHRHLHNSQ